MLALECVSLCYLAIVRLVGVWWGDYAFTQSVFLWISRCVRVLRVCCVAVLSCTAAVWSAQLVMLCIDCHLFVIAPNLCFL